MLDNKKIEYFPIVEPKQKHFFYEMLFYYLIFVAIDLFAYFLPNHRFKHLTPHFPSFFTFFGLIVFIVIPFTKKKTKIVLDLEKKVLTYNYITIWKLKNEKIINLENVKVEFKKHQNTWFFKLIKDKKCLFKEKESVADFTKEILEKIYLQLKTSSTQIDLNK